MKHEIRSGMPMEFRADGGSINVSGHAAIFNERSNIGGYFEEVIAPGAFTDAIGRDDVLFLVNHTGLPLARTASNTLTLSEDSKGLYIESSLDSSDPDVNAIVPKMKRGDLNKMSFAFIAEREEWDDTGDIPLRTIHQAKLFDVSIVSNPAYEGTDIGLRSLDSYRSAHKPKNQNNRIKRAAIARLR